MDEMDEWLYDGTRIVANPSVPDIQMCCSDLTGYNDDNTCTGR